MERLYCTTLAETLMRRFPDADEYPYQSWSYSQGFMLWGFIRLFEATGEEKYKKYVLAYCEKHCDAQGTIARFTGCSLDDVMTGSVLIWAFEQTGEARYRIACEHIRRAYDDYPRNPDGGFWHNRDRRGEMWVDGLFMGMMFLTRYGVVFGDSEFCFGETVRQLNIVFDRCEKDNSGLLYHAYSQYGQYYGWASPVTGKSPEVWSEGLGWYAMALVEVLALLPKDEPGTESLRAQLRKLLLALQKVQDVACGLWYQVVDKPQTMGNWMDTSGSAMFLYAFRKAQLLSLLPEEIPDSLLTRAFDGVKSKCLVGLDGLMNIYGACDGVCVQVDYDAYIHYPRTVNAKEAVAAVLWASAAMELGAIAG